MAEEPRPIEELTFREAMAELDGIVGVLESNTLEGGKPGQLRARRQAARRAAGTPFQAQQKVDVLMGELSPTQTTPRATRQGPS